MREERHEEKYRNYKRKQEGKGKEVGRGKEREGKGRAREAQGIVKIVVALEMVVRGKVTYV